MPDPWRNIREIPRHQDGPRAMSEGEKHQIIRIWAD